MVYFMNTLSIKTSKTFYKAFKNLHLNCVTTRLILQSQAMDYIFKN